MAGGWEETYPVLRAVNKDFIQGLYKNALYCTQARTLALPLP